jgi:shikimate dehydrogenase
MTTLRFAVIGDPVHHSISPAMQRAAFEELGIDATFEAVRVRRDDLERCWPELIRRFDGMNVTAPLKEGAAELVDTVEGDAAVARSVNTVVNDGDGMRGHSTDGDGLLAAVARASGDASGRAAVTGPALVLGAGGAARAVVAALVRRFVPVRVWARRSEAATGLVWSMRRSGDSHAAARTCPDLRAGLGGARLLVNATPVGGEQAPGCLLDQDIELGPEVVVGDLVYRPVRTELLARAEAAGCRAAFGLDVLVEQGARSFELWTGLPAPISVMREAAWQAADVASKPKEERSCSAS